MAAPSVRWVGAGAADRGTGELSLAVPAGYAAGDLLLAYVTVSGASNTLSTPSGWTDALGGPITGTSCRAWLFWRIAGASESALSVNPSSTTARAGVMVAYRGAHASTPIGAVSSSTGSSTSRSAPSVTTTGTNSRVLRWWRATMTGTFSTPTSHTRRTAYSANTPSLALDDIEVATPGASGSAASTSSGTGNGIHLSVEIVAQPTQGVLTGTVTDASTSAAISGATVAITMGDTYADVITADSPVAWWRLGEASGSTAADAAGSYDLSYAGSPTLGASGALARDANTAVTLNGSSQYVVDSATRAAFAPSTLSVEAWLKTTNGDANYHGIVVTRWRWGMYLHSGKLVAYDYSAGECDSGVSVNDGNWHHVAITFTEGVANGLKIYIDGSLAATNQATYSGTATEPLVIGRGGGTYDDQYFPGSIDEVAFYSGILSAGQISDHYQAGITGKFTDSASTGGAGTYRFDALDPGVYSATYSKSGYTSQTLSATITAGVETTKDAALSVADASPVITVGPTASPATVDWTKQYTVSFTATDAESTGAGQLSYQVRTAASGSGTLLTSGTATSGVGLTTATITDSELASGSNTRYLRVTDQASNTTEQSFTVTRAAYGALSGTITDSDTSAAIEGARVTLDDAAHSTTTSDHTGAYSLPHLAPGSYSATYSADGYTGQQKSVTITDGGSATQDVVLVLVPLPPMLTRLSPDRGRRRPEPLVITVSGFNFSAQSIVRFGGLALATTYLKATIPPSLLTRPGIVDVTVENPEGD